MVEIENPIPNELFDEFQRLTPNMFGKDQSQDPSTNMYQLRGQKDRLQKNVDVRFKDGKPASLFAQYNYVIGSIADPKPFKLIEIESSPGSTFVFSGIGDVIPPSNQVYRSQKPKPQTIYAGNFLIQPDETTIYGFDGISLKIQPIPAVLNEFGFSHHDLNRIGLVTLITSFEADDNGNRGLFLLKNDGTIWKSVNIASGTIFYDNVVKYGEKNPQFKVSRPTDSIPHNIHLGNHIYQGINPNHSILNPDKLNVNFGHNPQKFR